MIIDFKYISTFAQNKTNIPMKRIVLLLIAVLAMGCSKSDDKVDYSDINGMWNFKEETNYSETTCSLLVIDWKKEFFLTATEKIRNEEKKVSKKGTFKYEYPYLTLINDDGSYPIKFKITDDKKSLVLDGYIQGILAKIVLKR